MAWENNNPKNVSAYITSNVGKTIAPVYTVKVAGEDLHRPRWEEITVSRSVREEDYTPCVKGKLPQTTTVRMKTRPTACASLRESEQLSMREGEQPTALREHQPTRP